MTTIIFAGGGSGGHLFPGIAVAEEFVRRNPRCECLFVGSDRLLEAEMIRPYGFRHLGLCVPRSSSFYQSPFRAMKSFWQAYRSAARTIEDSSPSAIVGLGGGFSLPTVLAAFRRKIPVVLLEQNAVLGRANRMLLPFADHLCLSYANTFVPDRYAPRTSVTGNPVRCQIRTAKADGLDSDRPCLLILGGSQGAKAVNQVVVRALSRLRPMLANWQIIHQTGPAELEAVRSAYQSLKVSAEVLPFLDDIGPIYARTALAISRAGGTTLAELAIHRIPSILLPYPGSIRDHQALNARQYQEAGGAVTVPEWPDLDLPTDRLCEILPPLLTNRDLRSLRGEAMFSLAYPDASQKVADLVMGQCSGGLPISAENAKRENLARAS